MPTLSIAFKESDLAYAEKMLEGIAGGAKTAIRSAINDTLKSERAEMVRDDKGLINLPAKEIRDRINIGDRPTSYALSGSLIVDYHGVHLDDFKPGPKRTEGQGGGGISRTMLADKGAINFRHGFGAPFKSGHVGAVMRMGPKRAPGPKSKSFGKVYQRGPKKGQPILRQAVVSITGAPVIAIYEQFPELLDKVAADTADKMGTRLLSKIDWLLARGNTNFG